MSDPTPEAKPAPKPIPPMPKGVASVLGRQVLRRLYHVLDPRNGTKLTLISVDDLESLADDGLEKLLDDGDDPLKPKNVVTPLTSGYRMVVGTLAPLVPVYGPYFDTILNAMLRRIQRLKKPLVEILVEPTRVITQVLNHAIHHLEQGTFEQWLGDSLRPQA